MACSYIRKRKPPWITLAKVPEAALSEDSSQREINVRMRLLSPLSRHYETGHVQEDQIPRAACCMMRKEELRHREIGLGEGRKREL